MRAKAERHDSRGQSEDQGGEGSYNRLIPFICDYKHFLLLHNSIIYGSIMYNKEQSMEEENAWC